MTILTPITQTAHGFTEFTPVRFDNGSVLWVEAQADNRDNFAVGVVSNITANTFDLVTQGDINSVGHGLTIGVNYVLSSSVAGQLTTALPPLVEYILKPIDVDNVEVGLAGSGNFTSSSQRFITGSLLANTWYKIAAIDGNTSIKLSAFASSDVSSNRGSQELTVFAGNNGTSPYVRVENATDAPQFSEIQIDDDPANTNGWLLYLKVSATVSVSTAVGFDLFSRLPEINTLTFFNPPVLEVPAGGSNFSISEYSVTLGQLLNVDDISISPQTGMVPVYDLGGLQYNVDYLDISQLGDVDFTVAPTIGQLLAYDGAEWDAVSDIAVDNLTVDEGISFTRYDFVDASVTANDLTWTTLATGDATLINYTGISNLTVDAIELPTNDGHILTITHSGATGRVRIRANLGSGATFKEIGNISNNYDVSSVRGGVTLVYNTAANKWLRI